MINVTIWNEFRHEKINDEVKKLYPNGLHATIKEYLNNNKELNIRLAALDDPDQGLPEEVLDNTDVLVWWGHKAHTEVSDELVKKIKNRVYTGRLGLVVLHSGHHSKVFKETIGASGNLTWGRNQKEIVWTTCPSHPITEGIPLKFALEEEEMYCEPFYIGDNSKTIFTSWYEDGNVFRSGVCFEKGAGKVFYFQPGHETCNSFHNPYVLKIIENSIMWVNPIEHDYEIPSGCIHETEPAKMIFDDLK